MKSLFNSLPHFQIDITKSSQRGVSIVNNIEGLADFDFQKYSFFVPGRDNSTNILNYLVIKGSFTLSDGNGNGKIIFFPS